VIITDVLDADGEKTAAEIGGEYFHHDVTSEEQWAKVVGSIIEGHGKLDVLVNNAGIWMTGRMSDTALADYRRVIEVNQVGVFLGMQAASRPMMAARTGSIINISSIAGLPARARAPLTAVSGRCAE
jgi:3alpha(or 20beta)-hydroxysteroid dehydrogenase